MGSFTLDDLASTTTIGKPFTNNTRSGIIWWSVPVTFTLNCEMAVNTLFSIFSKSMNQIQIMPCIMPNVSQLILMKLGMKTSLVLLIITFL